MISRDTRLSRMPLWFMDKPSDTEMVVNDTGLPPPAATPSRAASAWGASDIEQGGIFALRADDPDLRLFEIMVIEAAGPQERRGAACGRDHRWQCANDIRVLSPCPATPMTITLAKLGYRIRCFETRIRIAKAIAVCGAAPIQ